MDIIYMRTPSLTKEPRMFFVNNIFRVRVTHCIRVHRFFGVAVLTTVSPAEGTVKFCSKYIFVSLVSE